LHYTSHSPFERCARSFRSLNLRPCSARFSIQSGFWDRVFLVWYTRCFPGRGAYHGSRPGRCGFDRLCEAVQGEDRGEEEAGPIAVGPSSGLCVSDGIGEREGEVAGGWGKGAGGVEGLEGSGEDGIAPRRSTACRCRSKRVDLPPACHSSCVIALILFARCWFYSLVLINIGVE